MARVRPGSLDQRDLALLNEAPRAFDRTGWLFELKYDGFRILAIREGGSVRLLTRKGNDLAASFPEIVAELERLPDCAVDGELVVLDAQGIPEFDTLAARARKVQKKTVTAAAREQPAVLFAFDLLVDGAEDQRRRPLLERKALLAKRLAGLERVRYLEHIADEGKALFDAARRLGMEGIVAKNGASIYRAGRSRDWLKIKTPLGRQRTEERGDAWYEGGTASDHAEALLEGDAESASVTVENHALQLTRLNKVFWPQTKGVRAFTKRDYLAYLLHAARPIVAHLAARPLTLLLMPDGLGGRRVLEMHWAREVPDFVDTVEIFSGNKGGPHRYLLCNNRASLLWLANVGVLEFHPWHSRITRGADAKGAGVEFRRSLADLERSVLERPDYIVFDIDSYMYSGREQPGAEPEYHRAAFDKCKQAALRMREMLERASLTALVKTSGKTGLHVLAPIERSIDFATAREVSRTVCEQLVRERPRDYTMTWGVKNRGGRIFLDYGMNARAKSLAAPYCPRAVPGARVSMPVPWEILADLEPQDYRIDTALDVLNRSGDAWSDMAALKVRVGRASADAEPPQRERSLHR